MQKEITYIHIKTCKSSVKKNKYIQQKDHSFQEIVSQNSLTTWMFQFTYSRKHTTFLQIKQELCTTLKKLHILTRNLIYYIINYYIIIHINYYLQLMLPEKF